MGQFDVLHGLGRRDAALGGKVDRNLLDLVAQNLNQLAEGLARGRVGLSPGVGLGEREHGRQRPVFLGARQKIGTAAGDAGGVALVVALDGIDHEG